MEHRQLGRSGFKVPALSLGTGTFGGNNAFKAWGSTGVEEATRLVDICIEAGLTMFDSADVYSDGLAEEVLGQAIKGRRGQVLISTKATFRHGDSPNDVGSSRWHLIRSVEASLKRLATDYIDLFQLHGFDAMTPVEEVLSTLDTLVRAGKIRYVGCGSCSTNLPAFKWLKSGSSFAPAVASAWNASLSPKPLRAPLSTSLTGRCPSNHRQRSTRQISKMCGQPKAPRAGSTEKEPSRRQKSAKVRLA